MGKLTPLEVGGFWGFHEQTVRSMSHLALILPENLIVDQDVVAFSFPRRRASRCCTSKCGLVLHAAILPSSFQILRNRMYSNVNVWVLGSIFLRQRIWLLAATHSAS
jgi:hypothetical protein